MHDRRLSSVEFHNPFQANEVWKKIDAQLREDIRRGSASTTSTQRRGSERMREAFVRRSSDEAQQKPSFFARIKAFFRDWL